MINHTKIDLFDVDPPKIKCICSLFDRQMEIEEIFIDEVRISGTEYEKAEFDFYRSLLKGNEYPKKLTTCILASNKLTKFYIVTMRSKWP